MVKKRVIAAVLAATMSIASVGLVGCSDPKGENELWITYYKGGYGDEWVKQLAAKFAEENPGVKVRTDADTQLINSVGNMMENGTKYDLIFCHDITWEDYVGPGQIYCLDELYETVVDDQGTKFKDRIWDEDVLSSARYPDRNGNLHYYKVPWTIGTAGLAYNVTVMDRVDKFFATARGQEYLKSEAGYKYLDQTVAANKDGTRRYNKTAPVDYYALWQYCEDVVAANLTVDPDEPTSAKIVPFTWSGASEEWQWDYVVFDWWGQLAGPETMNTFKNFGNVDDNFNLVTADQKNPHMEVYDPTRYAVTRAADGTVDVEKTKAENKYMGWGEFKDAYELWYNLVAQNTDWAIKDTATSKGVASFGKAENEHAFAGGQAAMTPAACWIEYESKTFLDASEQVISLMPSPVISDVKFDASGKLLPKDATTYAKKFDAIHAAPDATEKTVTADGKKYNRVSFTSSFGDSALIPASSSGKDLAVQFLLFMQEEENAQMFTRLSGGTVLPYKYNYWDSFGYNDDGSSKASLWQQSIFDIDRNSTKFNNYTQHPMMRKTKLRGSARMTTIWPQNVYYYQKAWAKESNTAPDQLFASFYSSVERQWNSFLKEM